MDRRLFNSAGFGFFAGLGTLIATSANAAGDGTTGHKVVVQVSAGERHIQALALGNAGNYAAYYKA
jgi:hypothetical protein